MSVQDPMFFLMVKGASAAHPPLFESQLGVRRTSLQRLGSIRIAPSAPPAEHRVLVSQLRGAASWLDPLASKSGDEPPRGRLSELSPPFSG